MRAFIALELPEEFASEVAALSRGLKASLPGRFLPKENYHLTLAFLGEIYEAEFEPISATLDAIGPHFSAVPLKSNGLGKFGRTNDATVWLGIDPVSELLLLADQLRNELFMRGIPFDDKPFKAHITLARHTRIPQKSLPALAFPRDSLASKITLFKSILSKEGAIYSPLYSVALRRN